MSSDDGPSEEELVAAYEENFVSICCLSAVCDVRNATDCLALGRADGPIEPFRTYNLNLTTAATYCLLNFLWGFISAARVHAINGRQWRLPLIIMTLYIVPVVATIYDYSRLGWEIAVELATRISIIAADALVLAVTWRATFGFKRCKDSAKVKLPLTTLLLRDGTAYFSILLVLNIINIIMWTTNIYQNVTEFPTTLTTVLLSRFILNLRQRALAPQSIVSSPSQLSDIRFSTLIQSFSDSLAHGSDEPDKEGSGESIRHDSVEGGDRIESGDEHELGVLGLRDTNGIGQESLEAAPVGSSMLLVARV
ncbi:hypothetical protein EVJ58_g1300 [Rhodofomes roseus]|uniref:Transmembrane protein n=1 Tax=Rhodofomes roseus TaxID=34475 RepID=A0A4Y9Z1U4_9APHY|nr:hypothetical protein EVJ58_g1300 [Rhodofomes roseus]